MEYDILYAHNQRDLINKVNDAIRFGWEPLGAVVVIEYDGDWEYNQTMIKKDA